MSLEEKILENYVNKVRIELNRTGHSDKIKLFVELIDNGNLTQAYLSVMPLDLFKDAPEEDKKIDADFYWMFIN